MIKYSNGVILSKWIDGEKTLVINTSENGQPLLENFDKILEQYAKYITCICFVNDCENHQEILTLSESSKKKNLKVCFCLSVDEISKVHKKIVDQADYLFLNFPETKKLKREYDPFTDEEVWVDV